MKLLHRVLALGVGLILASPACTVEFGSMGNNGPSGEQGTGGVPIGHPTYGGSSSDLGCDLGSFSVEPGCVCDESERMAYFARCGDGICMGPVCKFTAGQGCGWEAQACPISAGSGGSPSTEPTLAVGGSLVTGSGGTPPGTPVSGGTTSIDPGTAVTGSGGTPPGTPVSGGTTSVEPGSGGAPPGTTAGGGTASTLACPAVTLSIPSCGAGALTILYDTAGCVAGFVCLVN